MTGTGSNGPYREVDTAPKQAPEFCLRRHPKFSSTLCVRPPGHIGAHHWQADSGRLIQWQDKPWTPATGREQA
jgi:hypothetical protein